MIRERGLKVDHSTVFGWIQRYAREMNKRVHQHLKMSGTTY
jgi:transposase-like protein